MKTPLQFILLISIATITFSSCNKNGNSHHVEACCQKKGHNEKAAPKNRMESSANSIYQMNGKWENAQNQQYELNRLKGKVQLMAMIFTHCGFACPRMVANIKDIEKQLPANLQDKVGFVLVSFDVKRDTPKRLQEYAATNDLNQNWTLLHGGEDEVRTLSMLLNTQYSQQADGNFDHSNTLTVLDEQGKIAAQFDGLDIDKENVTHEIEKLIQH